MSGLILGNGHQQPSDYISLTVEFQSRVKTNLVEHNIFVPLISGPLMA
jgi:hypothetical protein